MIITIVSFLKRMIEGIASKRLMFGFGVLSAVVILLVILSDSMAQGVGYLFGTMSKAETIQLIGLVIMRVLFVIGVAVLFQWGYTQIRAAEKKIVDSGKGSINDIIGKWIMSIFAIFFIGLLVALLVVLVSVMLSDCVAESVGNLLGIQCDKIEIIKFIGWAMGGVSAVAGITVLILRTDAQMRVIEEEITDSKEDTINDVIRKWIMFIFIVLFIASFIVLLVALVWVILPGSAAEQIGRLLGIGNKDKTQIIEFIGLAISGTLVAIGLVFLSQRTDAQVRAVEAQVENNRLVEKGNTQERFEAATEHLGHKKSSVRIAAFYEFLHLIKDNGKEYRKSILDILYAYMRTIIDEFARCEDMKDAKGNPIKPTEEIQRLLDILLKSRSIDRSDIKPSLQKIYFSGMDLSHGDLSDADLSYANLSKADLFDANLSKVQLRKADLSGASLLKTNLSKARLFRTDLSGAYLRRTNLSGASLLLANLSKADLSYADLSYANLSYANLSGANLSRAYLSKARLGGASYTNKTRFPEWLVLPRVPLDNGDKVRFPHGFVVPDKPDDDE